MKPLTIDKTNAACGALFVLAGLFFAYQSLTLEIGTAFRMGPGFFPLVLAATLILFGAIIGLQSLRAEGEPVGPIAWRGILLILPAPVFFGLTVRGLGFTLSLFITALIASFASQKMSVPMALALSAVLTLFSIAVFSYGLGLPFQLIGPWVRF